MACSASPRRTSPVWCGRTKTTTGIQDAGENVRIPNVPVSLKRYWFGTDATGTGWHLDETFNQTTTSDGQGHWIFDNLDVAGKRMVNGKETTVLYGFEVTVDDLPRGYGVTHMNRGTATTDSDLNEDTKLIEPGDPQGGLIVLAQPSDRRDLVGNGAAYILGPNGTVWVISLSEDSDYNDTALCPTRSRPSPAWSSTTRRPTACRMTRPLRCPGRRSTSTAWSSTWTPSASTAPPTPPRPSRQSRARRCAPRTAGPRWPPWRPTSTAPTASTACPWWTATTSPTCTGGAPTCPTARSGWPSTSAPTRTTTPTGAEAANSVVGAGGRVGITPAMSVLGAFQTVRTTPNAYGQKFNLLVPYNWVPEDGRSVDLGMTGDADAWRTLVFTTPWGTRLFYVKLPQTGDELLPWMVGLVLVAALGLVLAVAARRRDDDDEEEEETPEE